MYTGVITPDLSIAAAERPRIGILYPRGGSSAEYYHFAEHFNDNIRCYLIGGMHAYGGNKTHYPDPLRAMGDVENLRYPARSMRPLRVHAAMWASTSASFIGGMQWSRDQASGVAEIVGAPASNTALAFVDALLALGVNRAAILASYPQEVTEAFRSFLGEAGIAVGSYLHLNADAGEDAYDMAEDFLFQKAMTLDLATADALLVPDTAMAAFGLMRRLEARLGIPVLTANQVTIWQALRIAGARVHTTEYGRLFQLQKPVS
jgi:maleate cis-trans isomerase